MRTANLFILKHGVIHEQDFIVNPQCACLVL